MAAIHIQSSRNSLQDYVRSIGAPGRSKSNLFGLSSWLSATTSPHLPEQSASLLDNADDVETPSADSAPPGSSSCTCCQLSKRQRLIGFMVCLSAGGVCFTLAFVFLPFIALKARKFALLFSLGSLFSMCSFSLLWGPVQHARLLVSEGRLVFSALYLVSLLATLWSALHLASTPLTALCAVAQLVTLGWFLLAHLPGGQKGAKFLASLCHMCVRRTAAQTLPV